MNYVGRRKFGWKGFNKDLKTTVKSLYRLQTRFFRLDAIPDSVFHKPPFIFDQEDAGSCVGNGISYLFGLRMQIRDPECCPSRAYIYRIARNFDGETQDIGTYVSSGFYALLNAGYLTERQVPYSGYVVRERQFNIIEHGVARSQLPGRVDPVLIQEHSDVRPIIAQGSGVVFGIQVDQEFCDGKKDIYDLSGKAEGGHCMVAIGYDKDAIIVVNSWGDNWGNQGIGRIQKDVFMAKAMDLWSM